MDTVENFADEAARFEHWLMNDVDVGEVAAHNALVRLLDLYRAALDLPPQWSVESSSEREGWRIIDSEWRTALHASGRLPFNFYGEDFDPHAEPPEAPVVGMLCDDLADIYRDVISGLRAYQNGHRADAVWEWSFHLHAHWGAHATRAIRALHCWLATYAIEQLSVQRNEPEDDKN